MHLSCILCTCIHKQLHQKNNNNNKTVSKHNSITCTCTFAKKELYKISNTLVTISQVAFCYYLHSIVTYKHKQDVMLIILSNYLPYMYQCYFKFSYRQWYGMQGGFVVRGIN